MQPSMLLAAAGAVWLGGAMALGFGHSGPTVQSPLPFPWCIFAFFGVPPIFVAILPAGALSVWQPRLWRLEQTTSPIPFPIRSWVLLILVALLSFLFFSAGWEYGLKYQGADFTRQCAWISAGLAILAGILSGLAACTKDIRLNVLAHAVLFYWIASYAFPYLGELP